MLVAQPCPTLRNSMDCSLPDSFVHGIFQARILEWVVIPFSRGSSWSKNQTQVSWIAGRFFTIWATREALVWLMYCKRLLFMEGKKALFYMHWDSVLKDTHMWPLWGQCPREGYYIHVCVCELTVQIFCPFFNSNRATKCSLLTLACRKSGHPVLAGQYQERWQT